MNIDIRDWYRPRGGKSRLTTRRLLLIVDLVLDRDNSIFWRAVNNTQPFDAKGIILADIFSAVAGAKHPLREIFYDEQKLIDESNEKAEKAREREESRKAIKMMGKT